MLLNNLKKYLIVHKDTKQNPLFKKEPNAPEHLLKLKVVKGFFRSDIDTVMDTRDVFTPIGDNKDKLYFMCGCSVPRFKVRKMFTVTIKPENATAIFLNKNTLTASENILVHYRNLCPANTFTVSQLLSTGYDKNTALLFNSIMANNNIDNIYFTEDIWDSYTCYRKTYHPQLSITDCCKDSGYTFRRNKTSSQYQLLAPVINGDFNKLDVPIYSEDALLKHLNVGQLIITEEKYHELRAFGLTRNHDDLVLMMELMSNSDFEKSVVYLLFLLKEFGKTIINLTESNHVNFKSLLSYLGITSKTTEQLDINTITAILKKHNKFTKSNVITMTALCTRDYIDYSDNNCMWIKGPVLKKDYLNELTIETNDKNSDGE
jgi:hypothetical protein